MRSTGFDSNDCLPFSEIALLHVHKVLPLDALADGSDNRQTDLAEADASPTMQKISGGPIVISVTAICPQKDKA